MTAKGPLPLSGEITMMRGGEISSQKIGCQWVPTNCKDVACPGKNYKEINKGIGYWCYQQTESWFTYHDSLINSSNNLFTYLTHIN